MGGTSTQTEGRAQTANMTLERSDTLPDRLATRVRASLLRRLSQWLPALVAGAGATMVAASMAAPYLSPSIWVPPLLASIALLLVLVVIDFVAERGAGVERRAQLDRGGTRPPQPGHLTGRRRAVAHHRHARR